MGMTQIVMTVLGEDQPGLVKKLADIVADEGGNWLESKMARLVGRFAGIVHVEIPEEKAGALRQKVAGLEQHGLTVVVQGDDGNLDADSGGARHADLELVGHDRPGIVRQLSKTFAELGVNVEELATERTSAAMSGEPIFKANVKLALPAGLELETLREAVEKIASDLMVDVTVQ